MEDIETHFIEGDIHINPRNVSRSIYVTGFRTQPRVDDLIIHFQRRKNGGGDIESIVISGKKVAAVITFDREEGKSL